MSKIYEELYNDVNKNNEKEEEERYVINWLVPVGGTGYSLYYDFVNQCYQLSEKWAVGIPIDAESFMYKFDLYHETKNYNDFDFAIYLAAETQYDCAIYLLVKLENGTLFFDMQDIFTGNNIMIPIYSLDDFVEFMEKFEKK